MICPHCTKKVEALKKNCPFCGERLRISSENLPAGTLIEGFRIEKEIGRGGMGVVYLATQLNLSRPVALKVLSDELSSDSEFVERFFHEARAAACLTHPNIVQAYDAGVSEEGVYYFAMEYIDGESLDVKLSRTGPLSPLSSLGLGLHISQALAYAWDVRKMCHGDVKPDNILVSRTGDLKLADLGLAKSIYDDTKRDVMVTPLYAAPEIISGQLTEPNLLSDIYSFGATMYHVAVGHPPFDSEEIDDIYHRHLTELPVPPSRHNIEIPETLSKLLLKMLEKDPAKRPHSWNEIIEAFQEIQDSVHPVPLSSGSGKYFLLILTVSLFVLACGSLLWLLWSTGKKTERKSELRTPAPVSSRVTPAASPRGLPGAPPSRTPSTGPSERAAALSREWGLLRRQLNNLDVQSRIERLNRFLKQEELPENIERSAKTALESATREKRFLERCTAAYIRDVDSFIRSARFALYNDWNSIQEMLSRYKMLTAQGKGLPHLQFAYKNRRLNLDAAGTLCYLRAFYFSTPRTLSIVSKQPAKTEAVVKKEPLSPPIKEPVKAEIPVDGKAEQVLREILEQHLHRFQPDVLRTQMEDLSQEYRGKNKMVADKAACIAEALPDKETLNTLLIKWNDALKGIPLDITADAVFMSVEPDFVRFSERDGPITVRRKLRLTASVRQSLRRSILRSFGDPEYRKKYPEDLQSYIVVNSFFYDFVNAEKNLKLSTLSPARKKLLESLYSDICKAIGKVEDASH